MGTNESQTYEERAALMLSRAKQACARRLADIGLSADLGQQDFRKAFDSARPRLTADQLGQWMQAAVAVDAVADAQAAYDDSVKPPEDDALRAADRTRSVESGRVEGHPDLAHMRKLSPPVDPTRRTHPITWLALVMAVPLVFLLMSSREKPKVSAKAPVEWTPAKQQAWISAGQESVRHKLKDGDSARFREAFFSLRSGVPVSCGEVNAKNSFGGYGGWQRYIATADVKLTYLEEQVSDFPLAWSKLCR